MIRDISAGLLNDLQQRVTTLCVCWKIVTDDGTVRCYTNRTSTFSYDDGTGARTYKPAIGISPTSIEQSTGTGIDNLNIIGILSTSEISEVDLLTGVYDNAIITVFFLNYMNLSNGHCILIKGRVGEIRLSNAIFDVELRSLTQLLSQDIGDIITPICNAVFCDARCGLNPASYTSTGTITSVVSNREFRVSSFSGLGVNILASGVLTFTSGDNNGVKYDIKANDNVGGNGRIELQEEATRTVQIGDTVSVIRGCNKLITTCSSTYNNAKRFRGFPHVPGVDTYLRIVEG